jgi:hypothetical protein
VKDVLRVAQALPGTYCALVGVEDPAGARLDVAGWEDTGLSPSDRQVLHLLAELGVMYRWGRLGGRGGGRGQGAG